MNRLSSSHDEVDQPVIERRRGASHVVEVGGQRARTAGVGEQQPEHERVRGDQERETEQKSGLAQVSLMAMGLRPRRQHVVGDGDAEDRAAEHEMPARRPRERGDRQQRQRREEVRRDRDQPVAATQIADVAAAAQRCAEPDDAMERRPREQRVGQLVLQRGPEPQAAPTEQGPGEPVRGRTDQERRARARRPRDAADHEGQRVDQARREDQRHDRDRPLEQAEQPIESARDRVHIASMHHATR